MVDSYTKMKPASFKLQLQAILTTYYEDIKGVQGASSCHKARIVKPLFEDQEDRDDTIAGASAAVLPGATPAPARRAPAAAGRSLQLLHLPPAMPGRQGHWVLRERLLRLMPIKLVCLNLNRFTPGSSQTLPTDQAAGQIKKLDDQKDTSVYVHC